MRSCSSLNDGMVMEGVFRVGQNQKRLVEFEENSFVLVCRQLPEFQMVLKMGMSVGQTDNDWEKQVRHH